MQSTERRLSSFRRRSSRKKERLMLILTSAVEGTTHSSIKRSTSIKRNISASLQFASAISLVYTRTIIDFYTSYARDHRQSTNHLHF